jgi:predicted nuclease of restriction endonuclease-like (RecB) superfamily
MAKPRSSRKVRAQFDEVVQLIEDTRRQAIRAVNVKLIELYWKIGAVISRRIERDGWGKGTVEELAVYLARTQRGARGFSPQNLWRMRQFFEAYRDAPVLSTLSRELSWSANLYILSGTRRPEEREFYLRMAIKKGWNVRELARQIGASAFERSVLDLPKLSTALRELHPHAAEDFKEVYSLEFLDLPDGHSEADLHGALLRNLGRFITELGRDFCFVGSQYPVQVGNQDFAIDLVFFHRGLSCLVAIELKVREFCPEDLGKLSFYLEALDRDVKKPHERPSIGVLLCATKDNEVVEYALSRTISPALVSEYHTVLPPRALLQRKLHELYTQLALEDASAPRRIARSKPRATSPGAPAPAPRPRAPGPRRRGGTAPSTSAARAGRPRRRRRRRGANRVSGS